MVLKFTDGNWSFNRLGKVVFQFRFQSVSKLIWDGTFDIDKVGGIFVLGLQIAKVEHMWTVFEVYIHGIMCLMLNISLTVSHPVNLWSLSFYVSRTQSFFCLRGPTDVGIFKMVPPPLRGTTVGKRVGCRLVGHCSLKIITKFFPDEVVWVHPLTPDLLP